MATFTLPSSSQRLRLSTPVRCRSMTPSTTFIIDDISITDVSVTDITFAKCAAFADCCDITPTSITDQSKSHCNSTTSRYHPTLIRSHHFHHCYYHPKAPSSPCNVAFVPDYPGVKVFSIISHPFRIPPAIDSTFFIHGDIRTPFTPPCDLGTKEVWMKGRREGREQVKERRQTTEGRRKMEGGK